jgi:hypothetical protein
VIVVGGAGRGGVGQGETVAAELLVLAIVAVTAVVLRELDFQAAAGRELEGGFKYDDGGGFGMAQDGSAVGSPAGGFISIDEKLGGADAALVLGVLQLVVEVFF